MRYHVQIEGAGKWIERRPTGLEIDGTERSADIARVGSDEFRLTLDGQNHRVFARKNPKGWRVWVRGRTLQVAVEDERSRAIRELAGVGDANTGPRELRAPMPGLVVRVLVEPGQRVSSGDGLVVVEAMKMENELRADAPATVQSVSARSGDVVDRDDILITFEVEKP